MLRFIRFFIFVGFGSATWFPDTEWSALSRVCCIRLSIFIVEDRFVNLPGTGLSIRDTFLDLCCYSVEGGVEMISAGCFIVDARLIELVLALFPTDEMVGG